MSSLNNLRMYPFKIYVSFAFLGVFLACGDTDPSKGFGILLEEGGKKFQINQQIGIGLKNTSGMEVDSVRYSLEGIPLEVRQEQIVLRAPALGTKVLKAHIFVEGKEITVDKEIQLLAGRKPEIYTYEVVNAFPHDPKAFTQGLEFVGDTLYESTGRKGASSLRKVDFRTGEVLKMAELENQYFGEGLTVLNDTIFMLTWQAGTGFYFDRESLQRLGSFKYGRSKEGWGLCNDGKKLYKSDGTQRIWKLNPSTLEEEDYIETVTDRSVFNKANELEYVGGKIYANVWQKESMMIIDAQTGAIEGVVNFGGLSKEVTQHRDLDVFNGVAYHKGRQTFFVTGKNWDKLFEVRIVKRDP